MTVTYEGWKSFASENMVQSAVTTAVILTGMGPFSGMRLAGFPVGALMDGALVGVAYDAYYSGGMPANAMRQATLVASTGAAVVGAGTVLAVAGLI